MYLLTDLPGEVAYLLAHQIPAEVFGDLTGEVMYFVKRRVGELRPAGGHADDQYALPAPEGISSYQS